MKKKRRLLTKALAAALALALVAPFGATASYAVDNGGTTDGPGTSVIDPGDNPDQPEVRPSGTPSGNDKAPISVKNIEDGATVTAYKIYQANYTPAGLQSYSPVDGVTAFADVENPKLSEVETITANINNKTITPASYPMTDADKDGTYTSEDLPAGMYLVLVSGTGKNVYNPVVISVGYNENDQIVGGTVDVGNNANPNNWTVDPAVPVAKHTTVDMEKTITQAPGTDWGTKDKGHGASAGIGDEVSFQIKATVPSYAPNLYSTATFSIYDDPTGLTLPTDTSKYTVKYNGQDIDNTNNQAYTVSVSMNMLEIDFTPAWIIARGQGANYVTVDYTATVADSATANFDANTNEAVLDFSHDPHNVTDTDQIHDTDKVYNFTFNGIKVDAKNTTKFLEGAQFALYSDKELNNQIGAATSGHNGLIDFGVQLKAGTYYMKETKAPKGYATNDIIYAVTLTPTFGTEQDEDTETVSNEGKTVTKSNTGANLTKINVSVAELDASNNAKAAFFSHDFANGDILGYGEVEGKDLVTNTALFQIKNSTRPQMPSTGGPGTIALTLAGVAGVVLLTLYVMRRKLSAR